jgi:hypothetical protein
MGSVLSSSTFAAFAFLTGDFNASKLTVSAFFASVGVVGSALFLLPIFSLVLFSSLSFFLSTPTDFLICLPNFVNALSIFS